MININTQLIMLIMAIVGHLVVTVWWASKITENLEHIHETMARFDRELEKRDESMKTMWTRLDELRDMIHTK